MPTRSSGCYQCRKRKIRCDEGRPGCQRCATHGVECPGYRNDKVGGIEFHDQTSSTKQRAKEQYRAKLTQRNASDGDVIWKTETSPAAEDTTFYGYGSGSESWTPYSSNTPTSQSSLIDLTNGNQAVVLRGGMPDTIQFQTNVFSPISLQSPSTERVALYSYFIDTYLPKTKRENGHFSFYQKITEMNSTEPSVQQGLDSLALVQMGSLNNNPSLLRQSVRQYSRALNSLAKAVAKGQFLYDDDVLAAVTILSLCELYAEIGKAGAGWGKHVEGANQLIKARGPESIQSELALLLFSNQRHGSLVHSIIVRKAPFMAAPEWREVSFRVPRAIQDVSTLFYDIAIQMPGILQRHDELDLESPDALADVDALIAEAAQMECELRDWHDAWISMDVIMSPTHAPLYELRPIEDFTVFCSLCSDRTFTEAFMFTDFLVAYLLSLYWSVMHYLRANTQSLQRIRHQLVEDWYPSEADIVPEDELLGYVLNLCMCFPFFVEPISSSTGAIGIFMPLRCCAMYFAARGHWHWLKWIGSVKSTVFVKGLAPPELERPDSARVSPAP